MGWKEAKPVSKLEGREAIEIIIDENSYTIEVERYRFRIREDVAKDKAFTQPVNACLINLKT